MKRLFIQCLLNSYWKGIYGVHNEIDSRQIIDGKEFIHGNIWECSPTCR